MVDRNTYPYSQDFYREIEEEVQKIIEQNRENSINDITLIKLHLQCLEGAFNQYMSQVKEALARIEKRNHKEDL